MKQQWSSFGAMVEQWLSRSGAMVKQWRSKSDTKVLKELCVRCAK